MNKVQRITTQEIVATLKKAGYDAAIVGRNKSEHRSGFQVRRFSNMVVAVSFGNYADEDATHQEMKQTYTDIIEGAGYNVASPDKWAPDLIAVTKPVTS